MSLVVVSDQSTDDAALREVAEWCVRRYAEPADLIRPGEAISVGKHANRRLDSQGCKSFFLVVDTQVRIGFYGQHTAEGATIRLEVESTWVAQHERDDEVGSIAIERDGDVDPDRSMPCHWTHQA